MVLDSYNYSIGEVPVESTMVYNYTINSDITGLETYDQKLSSYRPLKKQEIPLNDNNLIFIEKETLTHTQTKISLQCNIPNEMLPPNQRTYIYYGKIKSLDSNGYTIMSTQPTQYQYDWKIILYDSSIEIRKQNFYDFKRDSFVWPQDLYVNNIQSITPLVNDDIVVIIRDNVTTLTLDIDIRIGSSILTKQTLQYNFELLTDGLIHFYDYDNRFENDSLLKGCIYLEYYLSDGDVTTLLTDLTELNNLFQSTNDSLTSSTGNQLRTKTVSFAKTDTIISVLEDTDVPDDKKVYIHQLQLRINDTDVEPPGVIVSPLYLRDKHPSSPITFMEFKGVDLSNSYPDEGFWSLYTIYPTEGAAGFLETGGNAGYGIELIKNIFSTYAGYITIYYTIEV